jgi:hypothetical protein
MAPHQSERTLAAVSRRDLSFLLAENIDGAPDELRDGDLVAKRSPAERFHLVEGQLDLCTDHGPVAPDAIILALMPS